MTVNSNSITMNATDERSGITEYAITTDENAPETYTSTNEPTLNLNVTFSNLISGNYYVWVKDKASNIAKSNAIEVVVEIVIFKNAKFSNEFGTIDYSAWNNWACSYSKGTNLSFYRQAEAGYHQPKQFSTANMYNVTGHKTLKITYSASTPYSNSGLYGACLFGLSKYKAPSTNTESSFSQYFINNSAVWGGYSWTTGGGGTINIDVSKLSGEYYFNIGIYNYQAESSFNVSEIILN